MIEFKYECWKASHNSDSNEGRGYMILDGYFTDRKDAERAVKGKGGWGSDGNVERHTIHIVIHEPQDDYFGDRKKVLGEQLKAKLTEEELDALRSVL